MSFTKRIPDAERFWSKVKKTNDCWVWLASRKGGRCKRKYGAFATGGRLQKQSWYAHRYSYFLFHGSIPEGLDIMHECDNGLCVNPKHLKAGTREENMADASRRDRIAPFGKTPIATHKERLLIMQMVSQGVDEHTINNAFALPRQYIYRLKTGYRAPYLFYEE